MSEKSPKHELTIAKQQLDRFSSFIISLADFFYGTSSTLDSEFRKIKWLLSGKPDYAKAARLSIDVNDLLKQESKFLKQKNLLRLSQIQKSLRQLTDVEAVNNDVKYEINEFIKTLVPDHTGKITAIDHFEEALSLFRKALHHNLLVSNQNDELVQKDLHEEITRELQDLVAPYYARNTKDNVLQELNEKLNIGLGHKELLECCLVMIRFVIKDVLTEASAASKLISDIHSSLSKINQGIGTTIDKSKMRIDKREQSNKEMKAQISAMENALSDTDDVGDLKKQTAEYLASLQSSLEQSEQEERVEQEKTIALLQSMQKRLEALEKKAEDYKQKLVEQRVDAMTDALTKLPNRMAYEEKIQHEWSVMKKNGSGAFMAVFDIDHFKQINDNYGHSVGDKTLQIIANHIRKLLPKNAFLARWGGEEFIGLLLGDDQTACFEALENLREKIAKLPFMFKGERVSVTVSIGLTKLNDHNSVEQAFEAADKLLYKAKQNGRNQTCV